MTIEMARHVRTKETGTILARYKGLVWVRIDGTPFSDYASNWEVVPIEPEVGDIWASDGDYMSYRVIGVDPKTKTYFLVAADDWQGGEWEDFEGDIQGDTQKVTVYPRRWPEKHLKLKRRP